MKVDSQVLRKFEEGVDGDDLSKHPRETDPHPRQLHIVHFLSRGKFAPLELSTWMAQYGVCGVAVDFVLHSFFCLHGSELAIESNVG